ncbi:hypothetical protein GSY69_03975 [Brevibacterium sp. 5221]|uniref:HutD family protein n=1 Tax=Brevibacterium rongguiense TaxID=2695267 RepID=A0A6N9H5F3_9MICO|nr:HutD family protein [Brevibacterium rongguiense]MYM19149.1 hypothetical protein [Brevibacterium rongguiense]
MSEPSEPGGWPPLIVRRADCREQPWANGQGTTAEVLRGSAPPAPGRPGAPTAEDGPAAPGADAADGPGWDWRVSIATVDSPSPFSPLPGIDRTLVCLGPAHLTLRIDGKAWELAPTETIRFRGEDTVESLLVTEPTLDFNVMVRRAAAQAEVRLERLSAPLPLAAEPGEAVLATVLEGDCALLPAAQVPAELRAALAHAPAGHEPPGLNDIAPAAHALAEGHPVRAGEAALDRVAELRAEHRARHTAQEARKRLATALAGSAARALGRLDTVALGTAALGAVADGTDGGTASGGPAGGGPAGERADAPVVIVPTGAAQTHPDQTGPGQPGPEQAAAEQPNRAYPHTSPREVPQARHTAPVVNHPQSAQPLVAVVTIRFPA